MAPTASTCCEAATDDDDDARTVTDFNCISEPKPTPKPKRKSKNRRNKITLTSSKPQIYSQQEFLSAAGGGTNRQSDIHMPQRIINNDAIDATCSTTNDITADDTSTTNKMVVQSEVVKNISENEIIPAYRKRGLTCVKVESFLRTVIISVLLVLIFLKVQHLLSNL